jgi:hypothetical protein
VSRKPKKWGSWPTIQPGGLPRNPHQSEVKAGGDSYWRTRPRGPKKPAVPPPTQGPKPPPKRRSGCGVLFWVVVVLGVIILIVKARQGH